MTVDRVNRWVLGLIGIGVVALGLYALGRGNDVSGLDLGRADEPLLTDDVEESVRNWSPWPWLGAIGLGALGVVGGLIWLRSQLRPLERRAGVVSSPVETAGVSLTLDTASAAQACEEDLVAHDGITDASVRVSEVEPRATVAIGLELARPCGPADVFEHVEHALGALETTLGRPVTADVVVRPGGGEATRVR